MDKLIKGLNKRIERLEADLIEVRFENYRLEKRVADLSGAEFDDSAYDDLEPLCKNSDLPVSECDCLDCMSERFSAKWEAVRDDMAVGD